MGPLIVDGRPVGVLERGRGGVPLLLLHGWTGGAEDFLPVLAGLAEARRVVAVDLPGHGASGGPPDPAGHALPVLARWVLRVCDALDLDEVHLLGHSFGGLIAQRVAAAASQRLHSLVLSGTGLGAVREQVGEVVAHVAVVARDRGMAAAYEAIAAAVARSLDADLVARRHADEAALRARWLRLDPVAVVGGAAALIGAEPLGPFLRGIDVPVLVVHGERDHAWTPAEQALLARTARGARRVVVRGAAHSAQREVPDAWLAAVVPFLRAVDAGEHRAPALRRC